MTSKETVADIVREINERDDLNGREMCDNYDVDYDDFDGLKLLKACADRIEAAHRRELSAVLRPSSSVESEAAR